MTPPADKIFSPVPSLDTSTWTLHKLVTGSAAPNSSVHGVGSGKSSYTLQTGNFPWGGSPVSFASLSSPFFIPRLQLSAIANPKAANWMDLILHMAGNISSIDIDIHRVPINRGSGLCRFPEYWPKKSRPERKNCNIEIKPKTTARVHAEIRPIIGKKQSWINRMSVDFSPNVKNLVPKLPGLEIDGFSAVDLSKKDMKFDRSFTERDKTVKFVGSADFNYENTMARNVPLATPFGKAVKAPPSGKAGWMFRFFPVKDTVFGKLSESVADHQGKILLWAYLPTMGLTDRELYKDLGIPYNTFPRKFDDLLRLLLPLFDSVKGKKLLQAAPYINPNTEYINEHGVRSKIPEDVNEIHKANKRIRKANKTRKDKIPEIKARSRGVIVDWIFSELVNDLKRFRNTPEADLPYATIHMQMKATTLKLPMGQVEITPNTDLKLTYKLERAKDPKTGEIHPNLRVSVELNPLEFKDVDFKVGGYRIQAKNLKAKKVTLVLPSLKGIIKNDPLPSKTWTLKLEGVEAKGLKIGDDSGNFHVEVEQATFKKINFSGEKKGWSLAMAGFEGKQLIVRNPLGDLKVDQAKISKAIKVTQVHFPDGKPKDMYLKIPSIESKGSFALGKAGDSAMEIQVKGSSTLKDIYFERHWNDKGSTMEGKLDFSGVVSTAQLKSQKLGTATFTTIEEKSKGDKAQNLSGSMVTKATLPKTKGKGPIKSEFTIEVKLPYVGFETDGRLKIPKGSSTLRDGKLTLTQDSIGFEGDVKIQNTKLTGFGEGLTKLGNLVFEKDSDGKESPKLENIQVTGRVKFESNPKGWSLSKSPNATKPLTLSLDIADSHFSHQPDLKGTPVGNQPASKIIHSKVKLKSAKIQVEDLKKISYQKIKNPNGTGAVGMLSGFESGPLAIHHIEAEGTLWLPLLFWGYSRWLFPTLGGTGKATSKPKYVPQRPNVEVLTRHLSKDVQKTLGKGDFIRVAKVNYQHSANGDWENELEDLLINIHSEGIQKGKKQGKRSMFAMVRWPKLKVKCKDDKCTRDFGKGNFWANIFIDSLDRGGTYQFVAWPEKPKKKKKSK